MSEKVRLPKRPRKWLKSQNSLNSIIGYNSLDHSKGHSYAVRRFLNGHFYIEKLGKDTRIDDAKTGFQTKVAL